VGRQLSYYTVVLVVLSVCHLTLWHVTVAFSQETAAEDITARIRAYKTELAIDGTRVETRLQLAKIYLQIEAYADAVNEYRHIIALMEVNPVSEGERTERNADLAAAYHGLGLAYTGLEKFEDAIAAYQRAMRNVSDWAHTHAALASVYTNMHRYAEALDAYKVAVVLDPNDEMIHHQLGNVYSKRGERSAAMQHQQRAIAIAPEFAAAHYQLGLLYAQEKRWTDAIASYRKAYTHDEMLVEALYNLAQASLRVGNPSAAREQMALFEKRKATLTPLYQLRGALQREQGTVERAQILTNIARLYLKNGFYEKAVWEYQKALGMAPQLVLAYNGLGIAYAMLGKYSEAVTAQQKALELQPNFAKASAGLGLVSLRQNQTEAALEHYQRAVDSDPQFLEAHLKIGFILLNQERYAEAIDTYRTILKIKPDDPEIYYNLGLCYAHQARVIDDTFQSSEDLMVSALGALEKAVELSLSDTDDSNKAEQLPTQPPFLMEAYYLIGELQGSKGDLDAAERAYLTSGLPKAYHALAQLRAKFAKKNEVGGERGMDLEIARRYAEEAICLDPNVASYYNTLALIDFRRGAYQQAEKAIRKALELEPENRNYRQGLKQISGKLAVE